VTASALLESSVVLTLVVEVPTVDVLIIVVPVLVASAVVSPSSPAHETVTNPKVRPSVIPTASQEGAVALRWAAPQKGHRDSPASIRHSHEKQSVKVDTEPSLTEF
jgi:hypothetical protein